MITQGKQYTRVKNIVTCIVGIQTCAISAPSHIQALPDHVRIAPLTIMLHNRTVPTAASLGLVNHQAASTLIAFDLHNVLIEQRLFKIFMQVMRKNLRCSLLAFNPKFLNRLRKGIKKGYVIEQLVIELSRKYPQLTAVKKDIIEAFNNEPLKQDTIAIAKQLKEQGYTLYLLSNIAPETLESFSRQHPEVRDLFDGICVPSIANGYLKKPDPRFYNKFKQQITADGHGHKEIVFIDDRAKNIQAAEKEGFTGIVFSNAQQLKIDLHNKGILSL